MGIIWENDAAIVPNQALYQAEPQPEMTKFVRERGPYFAYFNLNRKDRA